MAGGVAQKVLQSPAHRLRAQPHHAPRPSDLAQRYRLPRAYRIGDHLGQKGSRIDRFGIFHRVATGKGQEFIHHALHLLDVALQRLGFLILGQKG